MRLRSDGERIVPRTFVTGLPLRRRHRFAGGGYVVVFVVGRASFAPPPAALYFDTPHALRLPAGRAYWTLQFTLPTHTFPTTTHTRLVLIPFTLYHTDMHSPTPITHHPVTHTWTYLLLFISLPPLFYFFLLLVYFECQFAHTHHTPHTHATHTHTTLPTPRAFGVNEHLLLSHTFIYLTTTCHHTLPPLPSRAFAFVKNFLRAFRSLKVCCPFPHLFKKEGRTILVVWFGYTPILVRFIRCDNVIVRDGWTHTIPPPRAAYLPHNAPDYLRQDRSFCILRLYAAVPFPAFLVGLVCGTGGDGLPSPPDRARTPAADDATYFPTILDETFVAWTFCFTHTLRTYHCGRDRAFRAHDAFIYTPPPHTPTHHLPHLLFPLLPPRAHLGSLTFVEDTPHRTPPPLHIYPTHKFQKIPFQENLVP